MKNMQSIGQFAYALLLLISISSLKANKKHTSNKSEGTKKFLNYHQILRNATNVLNAAPPSNNIKRDIDPFAYPAAYAYNTIRQTVEADGFVSFNHSLTADWCCIVPPCVDDKGDVKWGGNDSETFLIRCSGWYLFFYEVRGKPKKHSYPLAFEIVSKVEGNCSVIEGTRYASEHISDALGPNDFEVVQGFALAFIEVPDNPPLSKATVNSKNEIEDSQKVDSTKGISCPVHIKLRNVTDRKKSDVRLIRKVRKQKHVVNASFMIVKLPAILPV